MPLNEYGEFVRDKPAPELPPEDKLRIECLRLRGSQNHLPKGFKGEPPARVLYYGPQHIQEVEVSRGIIQQLSSQTGVSEFLSPTGRKIKITDLVKEVDRDLEFSKAVHKEMGL